MALTAAQFFGDASKVSGLGAVERQLVFTDARTQSFEFTSAGGNVLLPDATVIPGTGHVLTLLNIGAETFGVKDSESSALFSLLVNEWAVLYLIDNTTAAGVWEKYIGTWEAA